MQTLIMNWFTYLYSGVGLVLGVGVYLRERLTSLLLRRARQQHQVDIDLCLSRRNRAILIRRKPGAIVKRYGLEHTDLDHSRA